MDHPSRLVTICKNPNAPGVFNLDAAATCLNLLDYETPLWNDIVLATIDFLARGGDQYPFRGEAFTVLGVSYQQALSNYIQDAAGLSGLIGAADYPVGGEGRITELP